MMQAMAGRRETTDGQPVGLGNPRYWEAQAEEARALAAERPERKATFEKIASVYDQMAERADHLENRIKSHEGARRAAAPRLEEKRRLP
jgi:hypothetical protein